MLLAEWKCDDHVQWGLWQRGGSGKHPVLHQLHSEAQRVSHLCGWVSRLGRSRPKEGPLRSVSTETNTYSVHLLCYVAVILCLVSYVWKLQSAPTHGLSVFVEASEAWLLTMLGFCIPLTHSYIPARDYGGGTDTSKISLCCMGCTLSR